MPPTLKFLCVYMQMWGDHLTTMYPVTFYCNRVDRHSQSSLWITSTHSVLCGKIVSLIFTITTAILFYQTKRFLNVAFCSSHTLMLFSLPLLFFFCRSYAPHHFWYFLWHLQNVGRIVFFFKSSHVFGSVSSFVIPACQDCRGCSRKSETPSRLTSKCFETSI